MHANDSFGEVALIDNNNIRSASVVCKTAAEFLRVVLHRSLYNVLHYTITSYPAIRYSVLTHLRRERVSINILASGGV